MPMEFTSHVSGHEMGGGNAVNEYLDADIALLQPGVTRLAGFPSAGWGQVHPRLFPDPNPNPLEP
jgi:hypothetical protein